MTTENPIKEYLLSSDLFQKRLRERASLEPNKSFTQFVDEFTEETLASEALSVVVSVLPILDNIQSEMDAQTYVRIHLDALGIEDRELFYDLLGSFDDRFKDTFVARIVIPTGNFNSSNGIMKIGGLSVSKMVKENDYYGVLYVKEGNPEQSSLKNYLSHDPTVDTFILPTSYFNHKNRTVYVGSRPACREIVNRGLYGILEIRTEKYIEPESCLENVKLTKKSATVVAVVNSGLFKVGE